MDKDVTSRDKAIVKAGMAPLEKVKPSEVSSRKE